MQNTILSHLKQDTTLSGIISQVSFPVLKSTGNIFHDLMSCIIEQQIHYRSTKKIFSKALEKAGIHLLTLDNFDAFEEKGLVDIKMSAKKYETLERTITFFSENKIDWQQLSDDDVRSTFKQIKGIGPWTIDMLLLYNLGRKDIFPADDYHLKLILNKLYDVDTSARIKAQHKAIAESWSPYRSYATIYLLEYKKLLRKK